MEIYIFSIYHLDIIDFIPAIPLWKFVPMPIPPIISFTNWFDFKRAIMEPTSNTLLNNVLEFSFIKANGINIITDITICKISSESRLLNQLLKKPIVDELLRHNIAKGDSNTSTLISMYLNAKLIIKANEDIESIPDKIPSSENASNEFEVVWFNIVVNVEKEMLVPNILFPSSLKNVLIKFVEFMKNVQICNEKLAHTPDKNAFKKNFAGDSILPPVRCEIISRAA